MVETWRWPKASYSVLSIWVACQAQPRRGGAVDLQIDLQPLVLLVGIDVLQLGHVLQRRGDLGHPLIEVVQRVALERVLIVAVALRGRRRGCCRAG